MAKEVFRIAYPKTGAEKKKWAKEYGMNAYYAGKHWALRKKDAELWHWLTLAAMNAQGVPIKSETVTGKNRYGERTCFARYSIIKED